MANGSFGKMFNIRAHEWPRVGLLLLLTALTQIVGIWGPMLAYATFLKESGVDTLRWVLVSSAVLSILATAIYTAFVDRVPNDKLLIGLYVMGALCVLSGLVLLALGQPRFAYPVLYLLTFAWSTVFNSHFPTYVNGFYDIQSAKRILPVATAGFRIGSVLAGLTMVLLTTRFAPETIIAIWLGAEVLLAGLVWSTPYLLKEKLGESARPTGLERARGSYKSHPTYMENVKEGFRYTAGSIYLRWMALDTLLLMMLLAVIEYASSGILKNFGTQTELANYLALLGACANVIILPILLFGLSPLIARLGLGNAKLIFPFGTLLVSSSLILAPGFFSASAGYVDRTAFRLGFQYSIDNLLFNAVPLRIRGRVRAFLSGLVLPLGMFLGSSLLFLPVASTGWFVPSLIGLLAIGYVITGWFTRRQYGQALVKMLKQEDYSFLLSQEASELSSADPAALNQLQKKLEESYSPELVIFIAQLMTQVGGTRAVPLLAPVIRAAAEPRTPRAALIDVLAAADLRGNAVCELYTGLLDDANAQVRQSAIAGLEQAMGATDKEFLSQMTKRVQDPDVNVRARVLAALCRSGDWARFESAVQALDQFLGDAEPSKRAAGVRVLGQLSLQPGSDGETARRRLVEYLADPADEVRLQAALAVESVVEANNGDKRPAADSRGALDDLFVEKMCSLLQDPIERVRQAALYVLAHKGTHASHQAMVNTLVDPSPQVRTAAVQALTGIGRSVVPLVHPYLNSPDAQARDMAAVVLSRVSPGEFGALVGTSLTGNLLTIYRNYGLSEALLPCSRYRSINILQSALREQNRQLAEEIFALLAAVHDPASVKIIYESLCSEDGNVRANAHEALESLTTPQTAGLIAPLFEKDAPAAQLLSLSRETWEMDPPDTPTAIRQLVAHPDNPWFRGMTSFALGEIGATLASSQARRRQPPAPPTPPPAETSDGAPVQPEPRRGRRRGAADLLSALMDGDGSGEKNRTDAGNHEGVKPDRSVQSDRSSAASTEAGLSLAEIETLLETALADSVEEVRLAAKSAKRMIATCGAQTGAIKQEEALLSIIEKIIFLKQVPFFLGMTVEQLRILANVCEEEFFAADTRLYQEGDAGGALYVVVNGRVGIEQEKRKGSFARLSNLEAYSYFGEANLFDGSPRSDSALALQDTFTLRLRREPLIALARQHPDLSLELINVLSQRLRETTDRVAELTRTRPRELHKLFDQLG